MRNFLGNRADRFQNREFIGSEKDSLRGAFPSQARGKVSPWLKRPLFTLFFFMFLLCRGTAQTPDAEAAKAVAIMPFIGPDDPENTLHLHDAVITEVDNLGPYQSQPVSSAEYPHVLNLPPDNPPDMEYLGASTYVLTGEFYLDTEDFQHFQLWLWNSRTGRLIHTDEMMSEDYEEALGYMPPLVSWIFSQIPIQDAAAVTASFPAEEAVPLAEETALEPTPDPEPGAAQRTAVGSGDNAFGRFYLGLRSGAAFNSYSISQVSGGYEAGQSQNFGYEAAILAEFRMLRFLSLQAEAVFAPDSIRASKAVNIGGQTFRVIDNFYSYSLNLPLLLKVPLAIGKVDIALFGGAYFTLPLGRAKAVSEDSGGSSGRHTFAPRPPIGFLFGLDVGLPLGPGSLFFDLRYGRDFGITLVQSADELPYIRNRLSLSLGYKFLLLKK
jgi:hypothetical protein